MSLLVVAVGIVFASMYRLQLDGFKWTILLDSKQSAVSVAAGINGEAVSRKILQFDQPAFT